MNCKFEITLALKLWHAVVRRPVLAAVIIPTVFGAICSTASAQVIDVIATGVGAGGNIYVFNPSGERGTSFAGQIKLTVSKSTISTDFSNGTYTAFCTELEQPISVGVHYDYNVTTTELVPNSAPNGAVKAAGLKAIYARANGAQFGVDNNYAKAFQIAVWEINHDFDGTLASLDTSSGTFSAFTNSSLAAFNSTILADLADLFAFASAGTAYPSLAAMTNATNQDLLVDKNFAVFSVPEPGSYAMVFSASFVLSAFKLRKRNSA